MYRELLPFFFKYFILSNILIIIGIFVDKLATKTIRGDNLAFVDTLVHFSLGVISWCMVVCKENLTENYTLYKELFACGCLSSFIDVDHFIIAKSFRLKDALSLRQRPPFHCTTLLLSVVFAIILFGSICGKQSIRIALLTLTAVYTHHLRDGLRRGLWIWPFGSTPPIPIYYYIAASLLLPLLCNMLLYNSDWKNWLGFTNRVTKSISIV